jgi:hypothetical protein
VKHPFAGMACLPRLHVIADALPNGPQSIFTPVAFMIADHFCVSVVMNALKSSGVPSFAFPPIWFRASRASGERMIS